MSFIIPPSSAVSIHPQASFSDFGAYLRFLRRRARLTQRELAIAVNYSEGQICHLERGRRVPELATLAALFVPALQLEQAPEESARLLALAAAHQSAHPHLNAPVHQPGMGIAETGAQASVSDVSLASLPLPGPLIGRVEQRLSLQSMLQSDGMQLVTLIGPPGVGKTHLALQLGHDLQQHFADGVHFVNLEPLTDPNLVMSVIAQTLDISAAAHEKPFVLLKTALHAQRRLLILDNIEQVLECAPLLRELIQAAPACVLLVTSRVALRLRVEHVVPVLPLTVPNLAQLPALETLAQVESMALLLSRLAMVQPDIRLTSVNALALAAICVRVDGLPLAIDLVASRGRLLSPQELLSEVAQHFQQLHRRGRDMPNRHRTLRAALHWSYTQLSEEAARLFARLSVFVGQWSIETVAAICDLEHVGRAALFDQLEELIEHSLLQRSVHQERSYFSMLTMMREYAQEQLHARGETETMRHALLHASISQAQQAEQELGFGERQAYWMERMQREYDSMRAMLEWALVNNLALEGLELAGALWRFWYMRGMLQEGRRWLEALLALPLQDHAKARAHALDGLGILAWRQGDYQHSERSLAEALQLYQNTQHHAGEARVLSHTGMVIAERGAFEQAIPFYQQSLASYRLLNDDIGAASVLHNLGNLYCQQNQHEQAMQLYSQCLTIYERHQSLADIALIRLGIGASARDLGRQEEAQAAFLHSRELAQTLGDSWTEATALLNLGDLACDQSDFSHAKQHYNTALAIFEHLGDQQMLALIQGRLGQAALLAGDPKTALGLYRQCLMLSHALGFEPGIIEGFEGLAGCLAQTQPLSSAKLLACAASIRERLQLPISMAEQLRHQAILDASRGKLDPLAWQHAWQQGQSMDVAQGVGLALTG